MVAMKDDKKIINKSDIILLVILIAVAVVAMLAFRIKKTEGYSIEIIHSGEVIHTMSLEKDDTYVFKTEAGTNTIVVRDGEAYVIDADCPDKICEEYKPVSRVGESIICLPHKLVVQVVE